MLPLSASQDLLSQFFAVSQDLLCIAGSDNHFKNLNSASTTRLRWALERMGAKLFIDFLHPVYSKVTGVKFAGLGQECSVFLLRQNMAGNIDD